MKVIAAFLLTFSCFAGELYQHVQVPMIDAYVDCSTLQQPEIPGFGGEMDYTVSVSVSSIDTEASAFVVYIRLKMEDGSLMSVKRLVEKPTTGRARVQFSTGALKPVAVDVFWVVRMHQEPSDQLIKPSSR